MINQANLGPQRVNGKIQFPKPRLLKLMIKHPFVARDWFQHVNWEHAFDDDITLPPNWTEEDAIAGLELLSGLYLKTRESIPINEVKDQLVTI